MAELDRIKRNVSKMVDMGAPESDIDAYIAGEGVTLDDVRNFSPMQSPAPIQQGLSIPETVLTQGVQGATLNFGDEVTDILGAVGAKGITEAQELMGGGQAPSMRDLIAQARERSKGIISGQQEQRGGLSAISQIGGAVLGGAGAASTKGGMALTNLARTGLAPKSGALANLATKSAIGAGTGATTGALYGLGAGGSAQDRKNQAVNNAIMGAAIGGAFPVASAGIGAAGRGVADSIVPKIDETRAALAKRADQLGIRLSVDQIAPSRPRDTLQKVSQAAPFSGVGKFQEDQADDLHRALAKTIGQDSGDLSPETIKKFLSETGKKFENTLKGVDVKIDQSDKDVFSNIISDADLTMTGELRDVVIKNIKKLEGDVVGDVISGEKLASFRSQLLKRIPNAPAEARGALGDVVEAIDDIVDRSITPEQSKILSQARREWRNFRTIEPLLEKAPDGKIQPTLLINRVAASPYIKASRSSVGEDELVDLARIAKEFMAKKGGSDTFEKSALGGAFGAGAVFNQAIALSLPANRILQSGYNLNPKMVKRVIEKSAKKAP